MLVSQSRGSTVLVLLSGDMLIKVVNLSYVLDTTHVMMHKMQCGT